MNVGVLMAWEELGETLSTQRTPVVSKIIGRGKISEKGDFSEYRIENIYMVYNKKFLYH